MEKRTTPTRANVAHHATTVALTPARVITSHVRQHYHARYKGRYRFFRLVFAFDVFLVGVLATLMIVDALILFQVFHASTPGVDVTLVAPPLRASDTVPLEAKLVVTDGKRHDDVSVRWTLPAWVDVIHATPPLSADGRVYFGTVRPGEEKVSTILAHINTTPGTPMPISFDVQQAGLFGFPRIDSGEERPIVQSGVLRVVPPLNVKNVVSQGSVPFVILNQGMTTSSLLTLRLSAQDGAPDARFSSGGTSLVVQKLAPHESRVFFVDLGLVQATSVHLGWELQDGAQVVFAHDATYGVAAAGRVHVDVPLTWTLGDATATVGYQNFVGAARLFIAHPYLVTDLGPFETVSLAQGDNQVSLALASTSTTTMSNEWSVLPVDDSVAGGAYGIRVVGRVASTFPFSAEARYYTSLGDQIGIGPLPPRVGEQTSYWIVWTIGPTEADMKQLTLQATLPSHVHASGKFTSSVRGTFLADANTVTWIVPSLPASSGEPVTFAFEVIAQPTASDAEHVMPLLGKSSADALDVATGQSLSAKAQSVTTDLTGDTKANNAGVVVK